MFADPFGKGFSRLSKILEVTFGAGDGVSTYRGSIRARLGADQTATEGVGLSERKFGFEELERAS